MTQGRTEQIPTREQYEKGRPTVNGTDATLAALLGPDYAARIEQGLSPAEQADVNAAVSRNGGSHAAALDVKDPQLAAEIDAMFARAGAR